MFPFDDVTMCIDAVRVWYQNVHILCINSENTLVIVHRNCETLACDNQYDNEQRMIEWIVIIMCG